MKNLSGWKLTAVRAIVFIAVIVLTVFLLINRDLV